MNTTPKTKPDFRRTIQTIRQRHEARRERQQFDRMLARAGADPLRNELIAIDEDGRMVQSR